MFTRNPPFIWNSSTDPDGDAITYQIQIVNGSVFNDSYMVFNVSGLTATNFTNNTFFLPVDQPSFWRVRAYDGTQYSSYSERNFTIDSLNVISLPISLVQFGTMANNQTNDTSDNNPMPFLLKNDGNIFVDIAVNGSNLWNKAPNPSKYFTYKIRQNESGAFINTTATMNYTNMPLTSSQVDIPSFAFVNGSRGAYIDINITVPSGEYGGTKTTLVSLTATPS